MGKKPQNKISIITLVVLFSSFILFAIGGIIENSVMAVSGFAIGAGSIVLIPMIGGIIEGRKYVKKNGTSEKTPEEKRTNVVNTFLGLISLGAFIGSMVCFFTDKFASGIVCIGIFGVMVVIIAIVNTVATFRYKNTDLGSGSIENVPTDENGVEIDTFDLYCDADDVFEEYRTGAAEEYLDADSFEEMLNEADRIYDRYMLDDEYHGNSDGELLYAQKMLELVERYNKIIASKNPEYSLQSQDKAGDDCRHVTESVEKVTAKIEKYLRFKNPETTVTASEKNERDYAPLCEALGKVLEKKTIEEQKNTTKNTEISDFTQQKIEKTHFSLNNSEVGSSKTEPEKSKKDYEKLCEILKKVALKKALEKYKTFDLSQSKTSKKSRTPRATVRYKGIKK